MCTSDLELSKDCYNRKLKILEDQKYLLQRDNDYQAKFIEIQKQIDRLIELKNAIEVELETSVGS